MNKYSIIYCPLPSDKKHIMSNPVMIPCGHSACFKCIESYIHVNKVFTCPFNCTTKFSLDKLKECMKIKNQLIISTIHAFIEEIIYDSLDDLTYELTKTEKSSELSIEELHKHFEELQDRIDLRNYALKAKVDENATLLTSKCLKNLIKCEIINGLINDYKLNKNFDIQLDYAFRRNIELPDQQLFGKLITKIDLAKLENFNLTETATKYDLSSLYKIVDDIVSINENYIIISGYNERHGQRSISKLNNFYIERELYLYLNGRQVDFSNCNEIKLASDSLNYLFICMKKLAKVVYCDLNDFNKIKCEIQNDIYDISDEKLFVEPVDLCYYQGHVYVLDTEKGIRVFDLNGNFENHIDLYAPDLKSKFYDVFAIKNPYEIEIFNNLIAVLSNYQILYIFDFDGNYLQSIESKNSTMCSIDDKYLATIDFNCNFNFYEKIKKNNEDQMETDDVANVLQAIMSKRLSKIEIDRSIFIRSHFNNVILVTNNSKLISIEIK